MSAEQPAAAPRDAQGIAVWAQYSKDRYDSAEKRLSDFRSWARQLAAAAGVVVGLEAALMSQVIRLGEASALGMALCLLLLLGSVAYQLFILSRAVARGYVGQGSLGPESPLVLADHVADEASTRRMIGSYYAKGADNVHVVAEEVVKDVAGLARRFVWSLWLLFAGMALTGGLLAVSSHARKAMTDTPDSGGSTPPAPAPASSEPSAPAPAAPSEPAATPLVVTPTPGRDETRGGELPTLITTPTPGQRITEGAVRKPK